MRLYNRYPVVNTQTGEQKEVVMSIHEWDQWKVENPDWFVTIPTPRHLVVVKLVIGQIRLMKHTLVGMMSLRRHIKQPGATVKPINK